MPRAKQLTLSHEDPPGMLAGIAKVLGNEKVNILSCLTMTSGTTATTHLVVDNVDKAKKALANARLPYTEADVLRIELPNTPEALAKFAGRLAQEDINITLGYQTSAKASRKASFVLAVSDLDKATTIRQSACLREVSRYGSRSLYNPPGQENPPDRPDQLYRERGDKNRR